MFGVALGDVEANQTIAPEAFDNGSVIQHFVLDDFATDAPVGVPVQQQRCAGRAGLGEHTVEVCRITDGLPGAGLERGFGTDDRARLADRIERVALPAEPAIPTGQRIKQQEYSEQLAQAFSRRFVDELQRAHEQTDASGQQTDQQ
ncbi:hypothetical protein D3C87_1337840 [compost metagenome]